MFVLKDKNKLKRERGWPIFKAKRTVIKFA